MKYNDYPLPDDKLINILKMEYAKLNTKKVQKVCSMGVLEQKSKLSELYMYISAQTSYLNKLCAMNKNLTLKHNPEMHLKILSDMGIENFSVQKVEHGKSCFYDYLKCETEILKILIFLIFLDGLNFNKTKLTQILTEQVENFDLIINN